MTRELKLEALRALAALVDECNGSVVLFAQLARLGRARGCLDVLAHEVWTRDVLASTAQPG